MRAYIVDDEKPAREELKWLLDQCPEIEVVGEAADADRARRELAEPDEGPDVVFLDIDMPGVDGIGLAECLDEENGRPATIFVTAYEEFAVDAFDVDAVDYLLKPVRLERLREALNRVRDRLGGKLPEAPPESGEPEDGRDLRRISVREGERYRVLETEGIAYFEAVDGTVVAVADGERYETDFSLTFLDRHLDGADFFRCHRSYIVRLGAVDSIVPRGGGRYELHLASSESETSEEIVPLARSRADELKRRIPWSSRVVDG
ncbi:MAG: LytR/AlgR family response regulator transcription factor [Bradymonadaceae bacterium]